MRKYRREPRPDTRSFPYSPDARYSGTASLAPRIYEGGGPRSGRGSPPAAAAGKASSVTALPCQLPQRGSRGRYAPFLPPAFMRGEGHAVAGGPPRRSGGESLLSHGCAAPAPPEGSRGRFVPFLPPAFMRGRAAKRQGESSRRSGGNPLSHGFAAPALPKGEPGELRPDDRLSGGILWDGRKCGNIPDFS